MQDWQRSLANTINDAHALLSDLNLSPDSSAETTLIPNFPLRVPREFVARMEKGNPNDPLLLQVLPLLKETEYHPGFCHDPVGESAKNPIPGLLHKYHGRVLLTVAAGCAIHCRYCFRRHFPYEDNVPGTTGWQRALDYINNDPSIEEVIFSGGDPLMLKDKPLSTLVNRLEAIKHLKRLRIHTRLPIVIPGRITNSLISCLNETRLQSVIVLHANHPNEIDHSVTHALEKFQPTNITLFNQSVLLKNINDQADCLEKLSHALFEANVIPYYLHLLDRVHGAAHFEVSEQTALKIIQQMTHRLPGFLVPKLVREVAGEPSKVGIK